MRSLWRMMASRWLGGQASHGLTGDPALLDLLMPADPVVTAGFQVRRKSEFSHRAIMAAGAQPAVPEQNAVSKEFVDTERGAEKRR